MIYTEVEGNLITLAKAGKFDVVAHGCNCFCRMKRGIAPQMAEAFACDRYHKEGTSFIGDINKLGTIDWGSFYTKNSEQEVKAYLVDKSNTSWEQDGWTKHVAVNCYTQYQWSTDTKPFDYEAFALCMRKINHVFKDKHIGMPQIGSHLAGGDWEVIKQSIKRELTDMKVTIVIFKP